MRRVSIPRLRSVRMKAGGATLRVLRNETGREVSRVLERRATEMARGNGDLVGFALVSWDRGGRANTSMLVADGSILPTLAVPGFVRKSLELDIARRAAIADREDGR